MIRAALNDFKEKTLFSNKNGEAKTILMWVDQPDN
jgi:hypothetical protein